ncbi:hypothetical protein G6F57_022913 [Rhizopus arrhizus]|nr:hypothetical protein G6F57_022913 [Rhizopus arrhizus]
MAPRSLPVLARHAGSAASAAAMARAVSAWPRFGTVPSGLASKGLRTVMVARLSASHQAPPMYACCRSSWLFCRFIALRSIHPSCAVRSNRRAGRYFWGE